MMTASPLSVPEVVFFGLTLLATTVSTGIVLWLAEYNHE